MAEYLINGTTLEGIADAIRSKTGTASPIAASAMAEMISEIMDADALIQRNITNIKSNAVSVGEYAFYENKTLESIELPLAAAIGTNAFYKCSALKSIDAPLTASIGTASLGYCTSLESVNMPSLTSIAASAFSNIQSLKSVCLPSVQEVLMVAFYNNSGIEKIDLPMANHIAIQAFYNCSSLKALLLRADSAATLENANAFQQTPIANGEGYIYVPRAVLNDYKAATKWSSFQFRALEDYTVDGTTAGELDMSKI